MLEKKWRTYIVLDEHSKFKLLELIKRYKLPKWELHADHFTVTYGRRYNDLKLSIPIGDDVILHATHLGFNQYCYAVKIEGFYSDNSNKHITLLVNRMNNGTPNMSNLILNWNKLNKTIELTGKLTEFAK
jgi:hypothetical protein